MALAALETYVEDRLVEAAQEVAGPGATSRLSDFYKASLENDLKYFHTPSADRIRAIFDKYLGFDISESWVWNHYEPARARNELNKLAKSAATSPTDLGGQRQGKLVRTR